MPMVVFLVGVLFATEKFSVNAALNMVVVGTGIAIASYGESWVWTFHVLLTNFDQNNLILQFQLAISVFGRLPAFVGPFSSKKLGFRRQIRKHM